MEKPPGRIGFQLIFIKKIQRNLPLFSSQRTRLDSSRVDYPFFNLRRLFKIIYTEPSTPESVMSLDADKVFDLVEWNYLFYTLSRFGFGPTKLIYTDPTASFYTNGISSEYFSLHRGMKQGNPVSPFFFFCLSYRALCYSSQK